MRGVKALAFSGVAAVLSSGVFAAEKSTALQLIEMAKANSPALSEAIAATFDAKDVKEATAWIGGVPIFSLSPKLLRDRS